MAPRNYTLKLTLSQVNIIRDALEEMLERMDEMLRKAPDNYKTEAQARYLVVEQLIKEL